MKKYVVLGVLAALLITVLTGCGTSPYLSSGNVSSDVTSSLSHITNAPLSLVSLPNTGRVNLDAINLKELEHLGLGVPSPLGAPPYTPYNENGMYWSEPFSLVEGDNLQITVYSDSPVSWFGVDWSLLDVRGVLATTELDEDGRAFDPQYPASSSLDGGPGNYRLTLNYKILYDDDCVLVLKNSNPENTQRLSVAVSLKPSISIKRIARNIPVIKNLVESDRDDMEE
jgi:hypothetical protein